MKTGRKARSSRSLSVGKVETNLTYGSARVGTDHPRFTSQISRFNPKALGYDAFLLDFGPFSSGVSADTFKEFFVESRNLGLSIIPVTGLARNVELQKAISTTVEKDKRGACFRLYREDLNRPDLTLALNGLMSRLRLKEADIHVVIDLKIHRPSDSILEPLLSQVPNVMQWQTLTVVSGAFRKDLTGLSVGRHEFPRSEWTAWFTSVKNHALARKPTFGDYTILHPYLSKPILGMNISASIRYTSYDYWVVMKGEGLRNKSGAGYAQYPANADLLTMQPEFTGAWFSPGDRYISEIALKGKPTGNPKTWLQAGISHHLAFTTDQMAKVFVSSRGEMVDSFVHFTSNPVALASSS